MPWFDTAWSWPPLQIQQRAKLHRVEARYHVPADPDDGQHACAQRHQFLHRAWIAGEAALDERYTAPGQERFGPLADRTTWCRKDRHVHSAPRERWCGLTQGEGPTNSHQSPVTSRLRVP